ncbi:MAG: hypothetical protein JKY65_31430 [Planctomycetes bacterium]|nr:hypothetical protein [Planctomycetota bacterium]
MRALTSSALLASALLVAGSFLLVGTAPAHADTVTLNNGREIHGRLVKEGAKVILIKTGSGVITIPKFKVATFSENENWGNYSKPRSIKQLKAIEDANRKAAEAAKARTDKSNPKKGGTKKGGTKKGGESEDEWTWGEDVTKARIEELTPIRDELLASLKKLGPAKEERLAGLSLSREEQPDLKEKIRLLGWRRRRGRRGGSAGSSIFRKKATKAIIKNYGVRAIPDVLKVLNSENLYQARAATATLQGIHAAAEDKEASLWLMNHFEVPAGLITLLDSDGDITSPFVRLEADGALQAIVSKSMKWPDSARNPSPSRAEAKARKKWRRWRAKNSLAFKKAEEEKLASRTLLTEQLEKVRDGINPLEDEDTDEDAE